MQKNDKNFLNLLNVILKVLLGGKNSWKILVDISEIAWFILSNLSVTLISLAIL